MDFKLYRRIKPTWARILTEQDYQERGGIIQTLEGVQPFKAGDYLAHDAKGEWPIKQATIERKFELVAPPDETGFAQYMRPGNKYAAQVPVAFSIKGMQGKPGDYLVLGDESGWVVDQEIFEQAYKPLEE